MQTGEVIRTHRKHKGMTQEELARRLGVTAPAVNKWEKGSSMPDRTFLAPIARLLDVSLDTLLSFRPEWTSEEIMAYVSEFATRMPHDTFDKTCQWAIALMRQYPSCDLMTLRLGHQMQAWRTLADVPHADAWDKVSLGCFQRVLNHEGSPDRLEALRRFSASICQRSNMPGGGLSIL